MNRLLCTSLLRRKIFWLSSSQSTVVLQRFESRVTSCKEQGGGVNTITIHSLDSIKNSPLEISHFTVSFPPVSKPWQSLLVWGLKKIPLFFLGIGVGAETTII